jgi:ABC-type polar amino acid transport system ATPase subunit
MTVAQGETICLLLPSSYGRSLLLPCINRLAMTNNAVCISGNPHGDARQPAHHDERRHRGQIFMKIGILTTADKRSRS